ncbi:MAG: type III pantothenate kinase [Lachnospiraceae bacterium]|nr:type III pantothenate kinase [Lachnospiraceae bacterium]
MIFAIDIGNTNITFGCIDDKKVYFTERVSSDHNKTPFEYAIIFQNILDFQKITCEQIEGSIISSVVPSIGDTVAQAVTRVLGRSPLVVGPGVKTGLNILIENPAQLGADLVVGAVAALEKYPCPMIIFDMGTATTVSVIDKNRNFLGGMIAPGIRAAAQAMSQTTAQLPDISPAIPKHVIGRNTIECMRGGLIFGNAAMMDGLIDRINDELGAQATVIATGGMARYVIPSCRRKVIYDDDLLLFGLYLIYKKNV